jgi:phosphoribosylaminoimidazole-succinocarboxamide synthase
MKSLALSIDKKSRDFAEGRGILIPDTKMDFGTKDRKLLLIDELFYARLFEIGTLYQ